MRIVLSNTAGTPLYEQIAEQVKAAILSGELTEGHALPSVRGLARDLRISVITTSRAYSELAGEGFITVQQGKGAYVMPVDSQLVREQMLRRVEASLESAIEAAQFARLESSDIHGIVDVLWDAKSGAAREPRKQ